MKTRITFSQLKHLINEGVRSEDPLDLNSEMGWYVLVEDCSYKKCVAVFSSEADARKEFERKVLSLEDLGFEWREELSRDGYRQAENPYFLEIYLGKGGE